MNSAFTTVRTTGVWAGRTIQGGDYAVLQSPVNPVWLSYYLRWYPTGIKIIPDDFIVNSTSLRWEFYGDGSTTYHQQHVDLKLATNGFVYTDCEMLRLKLEQVGISLRVNKSHVMRTKQDETVRTFLKFVGNSEVYSMQYKWKFPLG
jgi:hypothetical protein